MKYTVTILFILLLGLTMESTNTMGLLGKLFNPPADQSAGTTPPQHQEIILRTADGSPVTVGQLNVQIDPQFHNTNNLSQSTNVWQSTVVNVVNTLTQISNQVNEKAHSLDLFIGKHKDRIFFYSLLSAYLMLYIRLMRDNHFLKRTDLWASWKHQIPFEELCAQPQQELAKDLLHDIQQKNINSKEPTNFISPLVHFLQDVQQEHVRIRRYLTIATWIMRLRVKLLFPINANTIALAQERKMRLAFVRHIFLTWATEHNVQQVNQQIKRSIIGQVSWYFARKTVRACCLCALRQIAKVWPISMVLSDIQTVYQYLLYRTFLNNVVCLT